MILVRKPSGKYRFYVDLRRVITVSEKARRLSDASNKCYIGKIKKYIAHKYDRSKERLLAVPLEEESRPITAFTVPGRGLFDFKEMPFGLHSSLAFQRFLDTNKSPEFQPNGFAYLDDLVIVSNIFCKHLELLREVVRQRRDAGLVLNSEKCQFCRKELKYPGHLINENGIQTDPDKVGQLNNSQRQRTFVR